MAEQTGRSGSGGSRPDSTKIERNAPNKVATDNVPSDMSRGGRGLDSARPGHYGRNGWAGPSSLAPGERIEAAGARLATNADPDLAAVRDGAFGVPSQLRDIGDKNVPVHPAMRGAAPGPKVPDKLGGSVEQPVRKPRA